MYGIALVGLVVSNNKYALLGSLRATSQVISYELALGLSLVGVVLRAGSLNLRDIVAVLAWRAFMAALSWNGLRRSADRSVLHLSDERVRRDQPQPVRPAGGGAS